MYVHRMCIHTYNDQAHFVGKYVRILNKSVKIQKSVVTRDVLVFIIFWETFQTAKYFTHKKKFTHKKVSHP
jgi:hypothetical protein